jgi:hypothetical protein
VVESPVQGSVRASGIVEELEVGQPSPQAPFSGFWWRRRFYQSHCRGSFSSTASRSCRADGLFYGLYSILATRHSRTRFAKGIIGPKIRHGSLQGFQIPSALHFRRFGKGPNLRPPQTLGEDLFFYFDFPQSRVPVELFFFRFTPGLGLHFSAVFYCCRRAQLFETSFLICRNASIIRLSASAAFSTSPPAFSIMASMVSILAFSSGYSFSLYSKLGGLSTKGFSRFEKRSAMDAP